MDEHIPKKENKMGIMPIKKLLITMSLPMILSMLVQALYNIVDSIFVAKLGEDALAAVSLAFPIQNMMIAVAVGTGVGINALLSRSLGEKKQNEANLAAGNGLLLAILSSFLFAILGFFFSRTFFEHQDVSSNIIENGTKYLSICTIFSFGIFLQITFERLLQSTGQTFYTMIAQGTGAIINIILDPILIFGLLGFPKLGVSGAAIATVIGQIVGMIVGGIFNLTKNHEIRITVKELCPNAKIIKAIYAVGIPSIIMQSISSIMIMGMNKILLMFSSTAMTLLGIYFKLQSFIFMPVFGLNNGMIPIVAYNYGAHNKKRITATIRLTVIYAVSIMLVGLIIFQLFPSALLRMFDASDEMLQTGTIALRIISTSFLFAGYSIIMSTVFQALGNGVYSLIISVARQLVVLLPIAYLFAKVFGLNAVWISFPIAEVVSFVLSTLFLRRTYRIVLDPMES